MSIVSELENLNSTLCNVYTSIEHNRLIYLLRFILEPNTINRIRATQRTSYLKMPSSAISRRHLLHVLPAIRIQFKFIRHDRRYGRVKFPVVHQTSYVAQALPSRSQFLICIFVSSNVVKRNTKRPDRKRIARFQACISLSRTLIWLPVNGPLPRAIFSV